MRRTRERFGSTLFEVGNGKEVISTGIRKLTTFWHRTDQMNIPNFSRGWPVNFSFWVCRWCVSTLFIWWGLSEEALAHCLGCLHQGRLRAQLMPWRLRTFWKGLRCHLENEVRIMLNILKYYTYTYIYHVYSMYLRSHPHTPGRDPWPFTNSFWRNLVLSGGLGKSGAFFQGMWALNVYYANKIDIFTVYMVDTLHIYCICTHIPLS